MDLAGPVLKSNMDTFFELPEEKSVADYVLKKCAQFSDLVHPCITNPMTGESIQHSEVEKLSGNVATFLVESGFHAGDTVLNLSHDGAKLHVFFIGVWRVGGIVQCSYPEDVGDILTERILDSRAKLVLCDGGNSEACLSAVALAASSSGPNLKAPPILVLVFGEADGCITLKHAFNHNNNFQQTKSFQNVHVDRHDTALLLPTSGTTGLSKSVVYTHETLIKNIILFEHFPFSTDSKSPCLITGKQTHFTGSVCPLALMTAGRNLLMMTQVNLRNIFVAVQNFKVKSIFSFPSYLTGLVLDAEAANYDCSSIEHVLTAGMSVGNAFTSVVKKLPNVKSIITIYGMTEAGFLTSNVDWIKTRDGIRALTGDNERSVSCGRLPPGALVRVRDVDTGNFIGTGQRGELCFKNDLVCLEYWRNCEGSKSTFQDGWIFTGDLGFYDKYGNIYVLNRVKEIAPSEIENVILQHPAVDQACVVGIPDPCGGGSIPRAFVTLSRDLPRNDDGDGSKQLLQKIFVYINDQIASYKKLRGGLFVLPKFPTGKSGKILRAVLSDFDISKLPLTHVCLA